MRLLTRQQVREIDRRAIADYHVPGIVLMENAARNAAEIAWEMIERRAGAHVLIFCGPGNNGGDGLVIARHLHNRGVNVEIVPVFAAEKLSGDAKVNWQIVEAMNFDLVALDDSAIALQSEPDLVIDALLGTGATGEPHGEIRRAIELINAECETSTRQSPILSVDLPSGLDCDTGKTPGARINATVTVTFVAEKIGFDEARAKEVLGNVIVVDIGCPRELVEGLVR